MKRKTYFTLTGRKVELGKPLDISWETKDGVRSSKTSNLPEEIADWLVNMGVLTTSYSEEETEASKELEYYIIKMLMRCRADHHIGINMFQHFMVVCPHMVLNLILMEIALELDKKYPDHISNSEKIFTVSMTDGLIHEVPKKMIKSWGGFPAFRTMEDAKFACSIVAANLRLLFRPGKNGK